jgi:hypothetical protein
LRAIYFTLSKQRNSADKKTQAKNDGKNVEFQGPAWAKRIVNRERGGNVLRDFGVSDRCKLDGANSSCQDE